MGFDIHGEITAIRKMAVHDLREKYVALFGEPPRSRHKDQLVRQIAWRLQALDQGDLSERARRRAAELADDADLRRLPPSKFESLPIRLVEKPQIALPVRDKRLPEPGTILVRRYRGQTIEVRVREAGLEYDGQIYQTLTAVAKAITGTHWNGYHFFGLTKPGAKS